MSGRDGLIHRGIKALLKGIDNGAVVGREPGLWLVEGKVEDAE